MSDPFPARAEATTPLDFHPVAPGVWRLRTVFVNLYAVEADGGFVLVDTGMAGTSALVRHAVAARFGEDARPSAILMTHAHIDHVGNAKALAEAWDVPVFVHPLELPYVTGGSDYPPVDPTPGGAIAFFARFLPAKSEELRPHVRTLPEDGTVAELPGWRWVHTPGHTVGHVSFFRESDRTLIVGDAFVTADMDDWLDVNLWPRELSPSPTPFTPDWESARASVMTLADLEPATVACGHGKPIAAEGLQARLREVAGRTVAPPNGRYAGRPALYEEDGSVKSVPPPRPDPLPKKLLLAGAVVVAGAVLLRPRRAAWWLAKHAIRRVVG